MNGIKYIFLSLLFGTLAAATEVEPWLECPLLSRAPVVDGRVDDSAWLQCSRTAPFQLYGNADPQIYGVWNQGGDAFRDLSTVAAAVMTPESLYLAFQAETLPGATLKAGQPTGGNIWEDDCVEFFFSAPDCSIRQLLFNSRGQWCGRLYAHADAVGVPWTPAGLQSAGVTHADGFSVEVAVAWSELGLPAPPADGSSFRVNFAREGASGGGLSSWSPVGVKFLTPNAFGRMLIGSSAAYWRQQRQLLQQRLHRIDPARIAPEELASLHDQAAEFFEQAAAGGTGHAALRRQWDALERQTRRLESAGKPLLVQPLSPWNTVAETIEDFPESPLREIALRVPGSVPGVAAIGVANLSSKNYLGRLIFHPSPGSLLTPERFDFRENGFVELAGGTRIADPLYELPLGVMIRLAAGNANMIWIRIDTAGLPPGEYAGELELYPAYSGFPAETLPLKLTVSPVDLGAEFSRIWSYDAAAPTALTRAANINTALLNPSLFYPEYDSDGTPVFSRLDRVLDDLLKTTPKERLFLIFYPDYSVWGSESTGEGECCFPSPEWQALVGPRYRQLRDHLRQVWSITPEQYVFCPIDEPHGDPDDPGSRAWIGKTGAQFLKSLDPEFRIMGNPWRMNQETFYRDYLEFYDVLMPNIIEIRDRPDIWQELRDSGREIWSYAVLSRTESPQLYRKLYWYNAAAGFGDIASFYVLVHAVGDSFNNSDSGNGFLPDHHPQPVNTQDFGAVYTRDWIGDDFVSTRRLEGWIQGQFDYKLAQYCRNRIGAGDAARERELEEILAWGAAAESEPETARQRLLDFAEKLDR